MKKKLLAEALGISRQMVYKLIGQGMPDSIESARAWRRKNLSPCRTNDYRAGLQRARERLRAKHQADKPQSEYDFPAERPVDPYAWKKL